MALKNTSIILPILPVFSLIPVIAACLLDTSVSVLLVNMHHNKVRFSLILERSNLNSKMSEFSSTGVVWRPSRWLVRWDDCQQDELCSQHTRAHCRPASGLHGDAAAQRLEGNSSPLQCQIRLFQELSSH